MSQEKNYILDILKPYNNAELREQNDILLLTEINIWIYVTE